MTTPLRFRSRHVHATLFEHVKGQLVSLGWGDSSLPLTGPPNTSVNFETTPATYLDFMPDDHGTPIIENTIAVTLGDEPAADDWELGGGLRQLSYPVFVDIYGANQAIVQSLTDDVRSLFDDDLYLWVMDHTASPAVASTEQIEVLHDDVEVVRPPVSIGSPDLRRYWRVVKTMAAVYYLAADVGLVIDGGDASAGGGDIIDGGDA